jgi:ABC-type cobalamin/Fe3+-siderophores transport system ATPase subunit
MKIQNLFIEDAITSKVGLKTIKLENLASIVGLIGKNGSGKTRILDLIERQLDSIISLNSIEDHSILNPPVELAQMMKDNLLINDYINLKKALTEIQQLKRKQPNNQQVNAKFKELLKQFTKAKDEISKLDTPLTTKDSVDNPERLLVTMNSQSYKRIAAIKQNYFRRIKPSEIISLQEALPKNEDGVLTFERLIETLTENIDYNEIGIIHSSSLSFLKKLPHQLVYDDLEVQGNIKKLKKKASYRRYISLKSSIKRFLNKDLEWDKRSVNQQLAEDGIQSKIEGYWKLNGRPFNYNELSDGEKTLFAYALLFFLLIINPKLRIRESIIFIDEPELHLHPDAEIILIDSIRDLIKDKGQLWIATHSINILSHLEYNEIHIVSEGAVHNSSTQSIENALAQLLSLEERIIKLSSFLSSISDWTFLNFMTQCFNQPEVIEFTNKQDPQIELIIDKLKSMNTNQKMLLDFGSGKGRLITSLSEDKDFSSKITLNALEPNLEMHSFLKSTNVYHVLSSYKEIHKSSFDYIVLCNVLHEIKVSALSNTLSKIIDGLTDGGFLMIIEASILSKGELIEDAGFLLFGPQELRKLFNLNKAPTYSQKATNSNDIILTIIPKKDLKPINKTYIVNALKELEKNTLKKIEDLRSNNQNTSSKVILGRNSGFLSQLYINSKLAQKIIRKNSTTT